MAGQIELGRARLRFAEDGLRAAVRLDPSLAEAHSTLIYIYGVQMRQLEFHTEMVALSKVKRLSFKEVLNWSVVRNSAWEPGAIVGDLIRFVAADPLDRWSRLALADIFRRMGLPEGAERTLAILPSDDREANRIRAQIALDRADEPRIAELLDRARATIPLLRPPPRSPGARSPRRYERRSASSRSRMLSTPMTTRLSLDSCELSSSWARRSEHSRCASWRETWIA